MSVFFDFSRRGIPQIFFKCKKKLNVVKAPKDLKNKNFLDKFESMNFQESKNGDDRYKTLGNNV